MKNISSYLNAINEFSTKRILVIGDILLDIYLKGSSTRLCPEAPVPVVDIAERNVFPGGAANTVCNLTALGASVVFCSVVGADPDGDEAVSLMQQRGILPAGIVRDPSRKTITKSRIVSGSHVITRIDQGSAGPVSREATNILIRSIEQAYAACDGVIISDYDKGVVTVAIVDTLAKLQRINPKFISVDSKRLPFFASLRPSHVKPNYDEVVKLLGIPRQSDRVSQVVTYADILYRKLNAPLITVTLDNAGSIIIENGKALEVVPASTVANPYVAGAGDTYLSAFALSLLGTHHKKMSAQIATAAATIAIRKEDTSSCTLAELKSHFNFHTKYIADLQQLKDICDTYHHAGKRIVFTNGCFDILHSGHVTYLNRAKELGDVLIVGLNNDHSIRRIKGEHRPINGLADRLKVLAGLSSVDHIIPFGLESDDTPIPLIRTARPEVFAKGGDYTEERLPEAETVLECGGKIVFLDHVSNRSTTGIINKITHASKAEANGSYYALPS